MEKNQALVFYGRIVRQGAGFPVSFHCVVPSAGMGRIFIYSG